MVLPCSYHSKVPLSAKGLVGDGIRTYPFEIRSSGIPLNKGGDSESYRSGSCNIPPAEDGGAPFIKGESGQTGKSYSFHFCYHTLKYDSRESGDFRLLIQLMYHSTPLSFCGKNVRYSGLMKRRDVV